MRLSHITGMLSDLLLSPGPNVTFAVLETKSTPDPVEISFKNGTVKLRVHLYIPFADGKTCSVEITSKMIDAFEGSG